MSESSPFAQVSISEISERAQRKFPTGYIEGGATVLSLFGARSGGATDLIHLWEAAASQVTVVDDRADLLAAVETTFDADSWTFTVEAPAEACAAYRRGAVVFDVVIADGSRATVDYLWEDVLPHAMAIAAKSVVFRISGEFLQAHGCEISEDGIEELIEKLHGSQGSVRELRRRATGRQGTYWAVLDPRSFGEIKERRFVAVDRTSFGTRGDRCIELTASTDLDGCSNLAGCQKTVDGLTTMLRKHERSAVVRFFTSNRFVRLPEATVTEGRLAAAIFDVGRFGSMDEAYEAARTTTSKRGTVNRKVKRARKLGYVVKRFDRRTYTPDIVDVNQSKQLRGGKPMRASYMRSLEEMGGPPDRLYEPESIRCAWHNRQSWGVFLPEPGRLVGSVQTDDRLVGYIELMRTGNLARYGQILGHGDHLNNGVMYLLHFEIVEQALAGAFPGLDYLMYTGMLSRGEDGGLHRWKKRTLFEPKFVIYDEVGDWRNLED